MTTEQFRCMWRDAYNMYLKYKDKDFYVASDLIDKDAIALDAKYDNCNGIVRLVDTVIDQLREETLMRRSK